MKMQKELLTYRYFRHNLCAHVSATETADCTRCDLPRVLRGLMKTAENLHFIRDRRARSACEVPFSELACNAMTVEYASSTVGTYNVAYPVYNRI